ncbi:hypothetical protein PG991_001036 [Apiospora marii]|uniref:BZIP domain-containing protein n=1 Tax=Apiospora marii TaxID=335849 RepID=A0ABR1STN9_9PEZI
MIGVQQSADATDLRIELAPMPQLAEAKSRNDDWTGTKDAALRRRAQTRLNTRAYRKRKALEKQSQSTTTKTPIKSEELVECWDIEQQCVSLVPVSRTKQLYNAKDPLLLLDNKNEPRNLKVLFPLCPDHLITLLQFNVLRALSVNRTLISGILATPLDCSEETIHVLSCPATTTLLPPSLLPTTLQQTVLHGEWIDIFPCPAARDRMILAAAAGAFDEDELWADTVGGLYEGFPDDEMSEGFLRKWGWLCAGAVSDALEATNRWRGKRGEEPFGREIIGAAPVAV